MRPVAAAFLLVLLVITGVLVLPGCRPNDSLPFAAEVDEPHYRRGTQLLRSGRTQEALDAFLKVVERRGGDAPESHLECGILYLQHIKDPVAAIYHFRKYLALRPNSPQASRTRELIDTATKEFARTLPARPYEGQMRMLDMTESVERLQKENFQLKTQVAQMRGLPAPTQPPGGFGSAAAVPSTAPEPDPEVAPEPDPEPAPAVAAPAPATRPPAGATVATVRPPANSPAGVTTPATSGRVHTVQKGDSLFSISRQYYGNGGRVNDIVAANRGVLSDRNSPLKIGTALKLP
ncbi:MAG: LysM peptidoglycan-binding domain-containing protein [Opitutaceae bacterium]|nr:LysM peptidoglycan-binding domain-containing protein [Opitutaceae bacterium]